MHRHPRGFTLIELLLYITLTSVMVAAVSGFLILTLQARVKHQTITEVEQQGLAAMQRITQVVRNATSISAPSIGTSGSVATLSVIPAGSSPTVFDLSTGALRITEGVGSPVTLTNSRITASALTFTNLSRSASSETLRVQFTLTYASPSSRQEYDYAKTFTTTVHARP